MKIAIAQMESRAGDFGQTARRMVERSRSAADQGADLLVFPAATLCGVTPVPRADREGFLLDLAGCVMELAEELACPCLVPVLTESDGAVLPDALLIDRGEIRPVGLAARLESLAAGGAQEGSAAGLPELEFAGARLGVAFTYEDLDTYDEYDYDVDVIVYVSGYGFAVDDPSSALGSSLTEGKKKLYVTGQLVRCIKIENDGKECYLEENIDQKKMSQYTKEEFLETILDTGIVGLGGDAFPTYIKYNTDKKINTLVINAVECEPYNTSDTTLLFEKCEEILEAIDAIMEINHIEHAIIAVPKEETELIRKLNNFIGTYLNIEVKALSSSYPIGWERKLVKETKHVNYKFIPLEKGIIVNNVSTIYAIYEALKQKKPLVDRIVTFTGNGLKKQCNVKLKIGTLAKDVIKKIGGYQNVDDMILIAGGAMMGNALPSDELAISPEVSCVLVLPYEKNKMANPCIRCGKCVQMCPAKLNPVMIAEAYQEKNIKLLQQLEVKRCIGCGLCSFICPSNRNIRNQIKLAKKLCEEEGK